MAGYSRARSAAAFCLSLAVHAAIFGGSWYIYQSGRAAPVAVENVLGWESLQYLTEEEHAPAPPPAAEPPPPPPEPQPEPQPEPEPEPEPEPVVEEKVAPVEIKKEPPPPPKKEEPKKPKEKPKPQKEKPKEKPKEPPKPKEKPKPRAETPPEPAPQIRERPQNIPPAPRPVNIAPPSNNHDGQTPNAVANNGNKANGGSADGAQSGNKTSERNYNAGLQGRIASTVQKRKGRIRERGTAVVAFDIQANGQFSNIRIEQGSGVQRIDDLILESVRSVGRYDPPPEGRTVSKRIPLNVK